jgi:general secretion pathway protein D
VGDVFDIQITLDARQATSNYSTTISFDSNALAVANIAEGGFLKQGGVQSGFTNGMQGDGQISISGSRIDSRGITGKGMLATIRFRALAATNEAHIRVVSTSVQNSAGQRVSTALPSPFLISIQL